MFGLLLGLSGPVRNSLALVVSLVLCALLFYTSTNPVWLAWVLEYKVITFPVIVFVMDVVTKLTPWKGDDSLFSRIWKRFTNK